MRKRVDTDGKGPWDRGEPYVFDGANRRKNGDRSLQADIARKHYYQTTADHFDRAMQATLPKHGTKQQTKRSEALTPYSPTEIDRSQAKQNPKQLGAAIYRGESQWKGREPKNAGKNEIMRFLATYQADGEGFEPPLRFPVKRFSRPPHSTTLPPIRTLDSGISL